MAAGNKKTINKSDLMDRLYAENPHLFRRDIEDIVDAILDEITRGLCRGDDVKLSDIGTLHLKYFPPRPSRNPYLNVQIDVEGKFIPKLAVRPKMFKRMNPELLAYWRSRGWEK